MTKTYEFCMFSSLIMHVSSSIKTRGTKVVLETPTGTPTCNDSGWEPIWSELAEGAEVCVWALG